MVTMFLEHADEHRDAVFTALGLTELWIVSMYLSRSTLNEEKRGLEADLC